MTQACTEQGLQHDNKHMHTHCDRVSPAVYLITEPNYSAATNAVMTSKSCP